MRAKFEKLLYNLRNSLWFVSGIGASIGLIVGITAVQIGYIESPLLYSGDLQAAQDIVSTILAMLVNLITMLISITVVVLTLAAAQLGPRLIRSFMDDRQTQSILGVFFGTIICSIVVLWSLTDEPYPNFAVSLTVAAVLVCIAALFLFVHHLARSIISDNVISRVGRGLDQVFRRTLSKQPPGPDAEIVGESSGGSLNAQGYVQSVDYHEILHWAEKNDRIVFLGFTAGDHIVAHQDHFHVHPPCADMGKASKAIRHAVALGPVRTSIQDVDFGINQLVEVGLRALSPGINDPSTAIAAIDRITVSLGVFFSMERPATQLRDSDGNLRLIRPTVSRLHVLDEAFDQLRDAGEGRPVILKRLLRSLNTLADIADNDEKREAVLCHAGLVSETAKRSIKDSRDRMRIEADYLDIIRSLSDQRALRPTPE